MDLPHLEMLMDLAVAWLILITIALAQRAAASFGKYIDPKNLPDSVRPVFSTIRAAQVIPALLVAYFTRQVWQGALTLLAVSVAISVGQLAIVVYLLATKKTQV